MAGMTIILNCGIDLILLEPIVVNYIALCKLNCMMRIY